MSVLVLLSGFLLLPFSQQLMILAYRAGQ